MQRHDNNLFSSSSLFHVTFVSSLLFHMATQCSMAFGNLEEGYIPRERYLSYKRIYHLLLEGMAASISLLQGHHNSRDRVIQLISFQYLPVSSSASKVAKFSQNPALSEFNTPLSLLLKAVTLLCPCFTGPWQGFEGARVTECGVLHLEEIFFCSEMHFFSTAVVIVCHSM